ncbi:MAG: Lipoprotein-releasing system transmembrane protein LolE [Chlamydiae bacterium]|nr:Lipoprotein-releasing system transmembrane protein LolE [Chlamydiota bacterium]
MDFKLFIALKYLLPKRQHLSSSFIAFISLFVISLVVWLVLLFFSVTENMERNWKEKLTALNSPLRITPTQAYFDTYYYQSDLVAHESNYMTKTFAQKLESDKTDPIDSDVDEPIVRFEKILNPDGNIKDLIKELHTILKQQKGIEHINDFEVAGGSMRLRLVRDTQFDRMQSFMSAVPYFFGFDTKNTQFAKTLCAPDVEDMNHLLSMLELKTQTALENSPSFDERVETPLYKERLLNFFSHIEVTHLKPKFHIWKVPNALFPKTGAMQASAIYYNGNLHKVVLGKVEGGRPVRIEFLEDRVRIRDDQTLEFLRENAPIYLPSCTTMNAKIIEDSLSFAMQNSDLIFHVNFSYQGCSFEGNVSFFQLQIVTFENKSSTTHPFWVTKGKNLYRDGTFGYGVLLPKMYKKKGVLIGDMGYLGYSSLQMTNAQEQRMPIFVAGFYEPGLSPIANKVVLADKKLVTLINSSAVHYDFDKSFGNGFMVFVNDLDEVDHIKASLEKNLQKQHLEHFFKLETYKEFEFVQSFFKQFQSDRQLVAFVAVFILLVACSNVISFLILLVNSKKKEIGVLRAMGADQKSIVMIFCLCGVIIGVLSSLIGSIAAVFTLNHLESLIHFFGFLQQNPAFDSELYGAASLTNLSQMALLYVLVLTPVLSLIASFIPAYKASKINPCDILRSE